MPEDNDEIIAKLSKMEGLMEAVQRDVQRINGSVTEQWAELSRHKEECAKAKAKFNLITAFIITAVNAGIVALVTMLVKA